MNTGQAVPGMTLRDYFAAQAMIDLVRISSTGEIDDYLPEFVAEDAYKYADAMIEERRK